MREYKQYLFAGLLALSLGLVVVDQTYADQMIDLTCEKGKTQKTTSDARTNDQICQAAKLGNAKAVATATTAPGAGTPTCTILPQAICNAAVQDSGSAKDSGIFRLLIWIINVLTGLVGIVAVGVLVYAGILYASAGDNSQQIASAKGMITNTVIGIVAFALMFFALNWLIPGGVLN